MPKGVYYHRGIKRRHWNLSEESKRKISERLKGHKTSPETREKIRKKIKQQWDKGEKKLSINFTMLGRHHNKESKRKIGLLSIGRTNKSRLGMPHTEETKRKIRIARAKQIFSEEAKRKMSEAHINNPNRKFKNTSIELKIEEELKKRNINYQKQIPLCKIAIVDFYLPEYKIVIECDGDYWHNRKGVKEKDGQKDRVLTFNGFNIHRFWEHEINDSAEECINKLRMK